MGKLRLREVKQLAQGYLLRQGELRSEPGCVYLHLRKATHPQSPFVSAAATSPQAVETSVGIKAFHRVLTPYVILLQSHAADALTETSQLSQGRSRS